MRWPVLLLAALLAGCATDTPEDAHGTRALPRHHAYGSFTHDATSQDTMAVCAIIRERESDCVMMESDPPQFAIGAPDLASCEDARERVLRIPNTLMGVCAPYPEAHLVGGTPFRVREARVNVSDGEGAPRTLPLEVLAAWEAGGVVTLTAAAEGPEGEALWMTWWYRPHDVARGEVLAHERYAREEGTFDALVRLAPARGEPPAPVERVDARSFLRIESQDPARGLLRGTFLLEVAGACDDDPRCGGTGARPRSIVQGRFG